MMSKKYDKEEIRVLAELLLVDMEKADIDFIEEHGISGFSRSQRTGYYKAFDDLLNIL